MLKTYQFKSRCKGDIHISKTANIILPGFMIKQRWTTLRLQAKCYSNSLCWLKQLISPKLNSLLYYYFEPTRRSVGLSTARVVDAHRVRYQRRRTATFRHLIGVNVRCTSLDGGDRNGDRHRNTSTTVEFVWRQKSTTKLWARSAACIRSLAKLSLAIFSVTEPANWL